MFVIFKSVTFEIFLKIMESVGDDANSVFHEDQKFVKSDTFESDTIFVTFKSVTFEIYGKCSERVGFDDNNDLEEDLKIFKSDTFENYKSFVPVEVQSQIVKICRFSANASVIITLTTFADHTIYILKITILRTTQTSSTPLQFLKKNCKQSSIIKKVNSLIGFMLRN